VLSLSVLVGFVLGLALGGSPRRLAAVNLRGFELLVAGFALQAFVRLAPGTTGRLLGGLAPFAYPLSLALVLAALARDHRHGPPMWLATAGVGANFLVVVANGGRMPVDAGAAAGSPVLERLADLVARGTLWTHQALTGGTRLRFLADLFALREPFPWPTVFSVGDVLLCAGIIWLVPRLMGGCSRGPRSGRMVREMT
jgi:hypothetical protein